MYTNLYISATPFYLGFDLSGDLLEKLLRSTGPRYMIIIHLQLNKRGTPKDWTEQEVIEERVDG